MKSETYLNMENFVMEFDIFLDSHYKKVYDCVINNNISDIFKIKKEKNTWIIKYKKDILVELNNQNYIWFKYHPLQKKFFDLLNDLNINYIEFIQNYFNNQIDIINEVIEYSKQNVNKESNNFEFSITKLNNSIEICNENRGDTLLIDSNKFYIKNDYNKNGSIIKSPKYSLAFEIIDNKIVFNINKFIKLFDAINILKDVLFHIEDNEDVLTDIDFDIEYENDKDFNYDIELILDFKTFFNKFNKFLKSNYQKVLDCVINNKLSNKFTTKTIDFKNEILFFNILYNNHELIFLDNNQDKYIKFNIDKNKYCFDLLNELNIDYIKFIENWFNNKINTTNEIINYIKQNVNKESKGFCFSIIKSNNSIKIRDTNNILLIDNNKFYDENYLYVFEIIDNKIILNKDNITNLFNTISVLDTVLYHINNKENDLLTELN